MDLDGTLIEDDTLQVSARALLRTAPHAALGMAFALLRGRAAFKDFIARRLVPTPQMLRWRGDVVDFVRAEHAAGREVYLVTAAHRRIAEVVAGHLPVFSRVFATEGALNLKGEAKVRALADAGVTDFDFISDSLDDLPALRVARSVYLVAPSPTLTATEGLGAKTARIFGGA